MRRACHSEDNTLAPLLASRGPVRFFVAAVVGGHIILPPCSRAAAGLWARGRLSLAAKDSNHIVEGLFNIDAVFRGCLDEFASEFSGKCMSFLRGDLPFGHPVTLVADEHDGDRRLRMDIGDWRSGIGR